MQNYQKKKPKPKPKQKTTPPHHHQESKAKLQQILFIQNKLKSKICLLTKQQKSFLLEVEKHAACTLPWERLEAETGTGRFTDR